MLFPHRSTCCTVSNKVTMLALVTAFRAKGVLERDKGTGTDQHEYRTASCRAAQH